LRLVRVATQQFRNLVPASIEVDAPLVVFWGPNGQGKTNWLEAVGVLGTLRSFRTSKPQEMVKWGETRASVEGVAESEGLLRRFSWEHGDGGRGLRREDRAVDAVRWLSSLRASYFVPADTGPIRGEPALRRQVLDRAVLTLDPSYLVVARDLRRVMDHKSALLRSSGDTASLDVLDHQLAELGTRMVRARADTVARMTGPFKSFYEAFAGDERAEVRYRPNVGKDLAGALEEARPRELEARRPLVGPHRDDLAFSLHGTSARAFASQGQARSLILAWKLAELAVAKESGETPIFCVDDLGSELDPARTERLVGVLTTLGAQVFVSTTDRRFVPDVTGVGRYFRVEAGEGQIG
jgi:DNA replication and repair protein RecF